jgi:hypothetical protein
MKNIIKPSCKINPPNDTHFQGNYFNIAVCIKSSFPKFAALELIVYNIPVAPASGKSPDIAVDIKKSQVTKLFIKKLEIITAHN